MKLLNWKTVYLPGTLHTNFGFAFFNIKKKYWVQFWASLAALDVAYFKIRYLHSAERNKSRPQTSTEFNHTLI